MGHAVDVTSLEGLGGLSLGRLATDLAPSKSGVQDAVDKVRLVVEGFLAPPG